MAAITYKPNLTHVNTDGYITDWELYTKNINENWEQVLSSDEEAQKTNSLIGRCFGRPRGDGQAIYQIVSEKKTQLLIKVLKGLGDDWVDLYFGGGGWFPKKEILRNLQVYGFPYPRLFERKAQWK